MEIYLGSDPAQVKWASELARELVTARLIALEEAAGEETASTVQTEALRRALTEVLGDESVSEDLAHRVGCLIAALSLVGTTAIVSAGDAYEESGIVGQGEGANAVMQAVAAVLAKLGSQGRWL